jgi:hypothetical protein
LYREKEADRGERSYYARKARKLGCCSASECWNRAVPVVALYSRLLDLRNCYGKAYSVSSRCCITDRSESRLNCTVQTFARPNLNTVIIYIPSLFVLCSVTVVSDTDSTVVAATASSPLLLQPYPLQLSQTCSLRDANIPRPLFSIYTPSLYSKRPINRKIN